MWIIQTATRLFWCLFKETFDRGVLKPSYDLAHRLRGWSAYNAGENGPQQVRITAYSVRPRSAHSAYLLQHGQLSATLPILCANLLSKLLDKLFFKDKKLEINFFLFIFPEKERCWLMEKKLKLKGALTDDFGLQNFRRPKKFQRERERERAKKGFY